MDYSFYGGRPGQSMVIVKYFPSIAKMNEAFDGGDSYTEVGYGECVLINTKNPRNLEHGKLYKRGLQGAEYLGTIKGPAGYPPHMILDDYEAIVAELEKYKDENGNINIPPEIDCLTKEGTFDFETKGKENDLVPGYVPSELNKDGTIKTEAQYQDTIKWIYVSVRDFNEEKTAEETTVKIGFKIPYHVYEQTAYSISAYTEPFRESDYNKWDFVKNKNGEIEPNPIKYNNLAWRADDESHPFYSKWSFAVPQGVKGDSIKGLKVLTVKEYKKQRENDEINNGNITNHFEWEENKIFTDDDNNRQILVYEYYDYRNKFEGDRITKYLGDYNMIKSIAIDDYGTITIEYTHEDTKICEYLIRWIENIQLDEDTGILDIRYNTPLREGESAPHWYSEELEINGVKTTKAHYKTHLRWVEDISLAENGEVTLRFTQGDKDITTEPNTKVINKTNPIKWIKDIDITPKGDLAIYYNVDMDYHESAGNSCEIEFISTEAIDIYEPYGEDIYKYLYQINDGPLVTLDPNWEWKGLLRIGAQSPQPVIVYREAGNPIAYLKALAPLDSEERGSFSSLGCIRKNNVELLEDKCQWVEKINITEDGEVIFNYNYTDDDGQKASTIQADKLTWIKGIKLDTQDYQLIAIDNHGEEIKLGSTKVDSTLSIAFNIRPDETFISETENIQAGFYVSDNLAYLNKKFPKGLDISVNGESINEEWMKGKIITVGPDNLEEIDLRKNFYAFDYNRNQWYYLGSLGGLGALKYQQIAEKEKEENINAAMEKLDIGGVCYIIAQRPNNTAITLDLEE